MRAKALGAYLLSVNGVDDKDVEELTCPKCGELKLTREEADFIEGLFVGGNPAYVERCTCQEQ